jgi:hypothetical protein
MGTADGGDDTHQGPVRFDAPSGALPPIDAGTARVRSCVAPAVSSTPRLGTWSADAKVFEGTFSLPQKQRRSTVTHFVTLYFGVRSFADAPYVYRGAQCRTSHGWEISGACGAVCEGPPRETAYSRDIRHCAPRSPEAPVISSLAAKNSVTKRCDSAVTVFDAARGGRD